MIAARKGRTSARYFDKFHRFCFTACAVVVMLTILFIVIFISLQGLSTFRDVSVVEFLTSSRWAPEEHFGAFSFIFGSIAVTALALLFGGPLGLAGAIFMAKVAPPRIKAIMRPATDVFVGIPSVVYGWVGLTVFVDLIRVLTGAGTGYGLLASGLILGIMILPTVISISADSLQALPNSLEEASYALGATRWQTIRGVLLPAALPGLLTALILATARAIGETMAVQMVIGNSPQLARSLIGPTATLTSEIVMEMGNTPYGSTWNNALFAMALVLLLVSLALILIIRRLSRSGVFNE